MGTIDHVRSLDDLLSQGWVLGPKAGILAFRLEFEPQAWGLGLKAGIWASKLGFGLQGKVLGHKARI